MSASDPTSPSTMPERRQSPALADHQPDDVARRRTERAAHADLPRPLRDASRQYAVNSRHGEQQRGRRERREQHERQSALARGRRDRLGPSSRSSRSAASGRSRRLSLRTVARERGGIAGVADDEHFLIVGEEPLSLGDVPLQRRSSHRDRDASTFPATPTTVRAGAFDSARDECACRSGSRRATAGRASALDSPARPCSRRHASVRRESSSGENRNAHRREIPVGHDVPIAARARARDSSGDVVRIDHAVHVDVAAERQLIGDGDARRHPAGRSTASRTRS